MLQDDEYYFYDILVRDISITPQQQKQYGFIPEGLSGIWYMNDLNEKFIATYVHINEELDSSMDKDSYAILLFPGSIISISSSEGVKFYGKMLFN